MTSLQYYLRKWYTPEQVKEKYGIKFRRHTYFHNLVLFKYSQIESDMSKKIVQESRGIILDEENDWEIVGRPFDKFFNHNEPNAHQIDWSTALVQEKLDGSLVHVYLYRDVLQVATSGTPDALTPVGPYDLTFRRLFLDTVEKVGLKLNCVPGHSYMFELMTPYNRIVVDHEGESFVKFLACRRHSDGAFVNAAGFEDHTVRTFPYGSMEVVLSTLGDMLGTEQEGYVIVDENHNRVKVKCEDYVALHHMVSTATPKSILEAVRAGEIDEVVGAFPHLEEEFIKTKERLDAFVKKVEDTYAELKVISDPKEYAMEALKHDFSHYLFALRQGKTNSIREYFAQVPLVSAMRSLKISSSDDESQRYRI